MYRYIIPKIRNILYTYKIYICLCASEPVSTILAFNHVVQLSLTEGDFRGFYRYWIKEVFLMEKTVSVKYGGGSVEDIEISDNITSIAWPWVL